MGHRTLALLTLLAALTITGLLLRDRERDQEPAENGSPAAPAEAEPTVELAAAEPARAPLGRAEAHPRRPSARSELPVPPRADAEPARRLPVLEAVDAVLLLRALDRAGQAVLGELSLATKIRWHRQFSSHDASASTDGEGRFEVRIDPSLLDGERRELEVSARGRTLMACIDLSRSFHPGRTDMGDLVLTPAPLIAEGRVIDEAGQPVAGAAIHVHTLTASRDDTAREMEPPYFGEGETGEDGVFSFYGSTSAASMEVRLRQDEPFAGRPMETLPPGLGYVVGHEGEAPAAAGEQLRAPPLELPVGSRGIQIVAQRSGGVAGRVLLDPGVPIGGLRMMLRPENVPAGGMLESSDSSWSFSRTETAGDGRFQLVGLLPGRYTFSVAAGREMLVEIPGIEIVSGEITRDPRLQSLDLRGRLHVFTLDLVRPSPSFQLSGSVRYSASGTSTPMRRQSFRGSPVVVVTPLAAIDVIVRAIDCRIERLSALAERTEVRMRPAFPVRLVLPRDIVLPASPLFVGAELVPADARPEEQARSYAEYRPTPPFDEHGETICQACERGRMTVRWFFERRDRGGGGSRGPLDMPVEQVAVVEDREGEQRFELAVTQQALAAALAAR